MMITPLVVLHLAFMQDAAAAAPAQQPAAAPIAEPAKPAAPATTFGELASIEAFEQSLRQLVAASDGKVTLSSIGTSSAGRARLTPCRAI
jgi:hypothetical protein